MPHISLVFREMWDTTALDLRSFGPSGNTSRFAVSHISRKTSEIWGTRGPVTTEILHLNSVQCLPAVDDFVEGLVYQPAHFLGGYMLARLPFAQQISCAVPLFKNLSY